ncbi:putative uncharacterized protein DDB_G0282133 [Battus philenor]|uniref:putative uncharacterized protein DDB_G0282133 n=1 Tax=Battus philenor TaxID=42288 RepID=UPI0035D0BBE6
MEVAGQWRREWAGKAEYGKVIEDGVTKRVARAMEVLHASAPGARVRVLRAAYHSTAGPGAPTSSYMLQSSRRVITSGYDFVEPKPLPSTPLEISSLPLDAADTDTDGEKQNYKVTEPDDLDISEPSKWRRGTERNSMRMPSEESSSTDNASIIDLDSKTFRRNTFRNQTLKNNQNNDKPTNYKNNSISPLLDAPVTLSTLKYKSLLNGSNDWNNRRKSYSFEDTAPINKIISDRIDRFAIESSTDSGICKSSEVVNEVENTRYPKSKEKEPTTQEETFKDWLSKNRVRLGSPSKLVKDHSITPDRLGENNISLQSSGKVCITLPVTVEVESDSETRKSQNSNDEHERKLKKVEFCKTELHFAADTGTVNIIATDEKPPPTNDFRRRRSAFVPISDRFEKSVTLFGEKNDFHENRKSGFSSFNNDETGDFDENTAATKSILKNKIPKPKPYLLGENMTLGDNNDLNKFNESDASKASGVSLINAQLTAEQNYKKESTDYLTKIDSSIFEYKSYRTTNEGTYNKDSFKNLQEVGVDVNKHWNSNCESLDNISKNSIRKKLEAIQKSPTPRRSNSRQLRESDLMYFGIERNEEQSIQKSNKFYDNNNEQDEIFESVKLVRKFSNSVCSSEIESDEAPEYQNIPSTTYYTPVPAPRSRTKYSGTQTEVRTGNLNSIEEQENDENIPKILRRTRLRRQDTSTSSSRSISEPPKVNRLHHKEQDSRRKKTEISSSIRKKDDVATQEHDLETTSHGSSYLYVNVQTKEINTKNNSLKHKMNLEEKSQNKKDPAQKLNYERIEHKNHKHTDSGRKQTIRRSDSLNTKKNINDDTQILTRTKIKRTEKLVTPELSHYGSRRIRNDAIKYNDNDKIREKDYTNNSKDHRARSSHHHANLDSNQISHLKADKSTKTETKHERNKKEFGERDEIKHNKHSAKNKDLPNSIPKSQQDFAINKSLKQNNRVTENYDPKKSRRSEYVINYDDKKGTVSSVRKISSKDTSDIKKYQTKENKENTNEKKGKIKQLNKIALQKISDRYGIINKERVCKAKTHVQRACQLL